MPPDTTLLDVGSPFTAQTSSPCDSCRSISTRYRDRARSIEPIVELLADQYATEPGNYLAFFSSFDYLDQVAALFESRHPHVPMWRQSRKMAEPERDAVPRALRAGRAGEWVSRCSGAFAEGIDLPGNRLIGAFIATLGLPQINAVNEEMQQRMQARFGARLRIHLPLSGLAEGGAGGGTRHPHDLRSRHLVSDR